MAISIDPRKKNEVYSSLKSSLKGKIQELTNFSENSFNFVWANSFAEEKHEEEVAALAAQLSGWADYAGKDITQDDLDTLGVDGATPEEVNKYIKDDQLDELGKIVGVTRDQGSKATGQVEITISESTTIPKGTEFGTQPDSGGNFLSFFTTKEVSASGSTTVTADIQAAEVGDEYNVGSGTITYMPNPPVGVEGVTNPSGTTGGTDIQSNSSLRTDIKNAVIESAKGGTVDGIEAYIADNTEAIDVIVEEEFTGDSEHGSYPHGDVIVLGGTDAEVQDAIDFSHPSAVEHILVRPNQYGVNIEVKVEGTDIDTAEIENDLSNYLAGLLLGDDVIRDKIIQTVMNADPDIENITPSEGPFIEINKETHTISGETIDGFEDGDITVSDSDWSGWNGDTGALTAQTGTVLKGSYSGELASANANNVVSTSRSAEISNQAESLLQIDNQTTNSGDSVIIEFLSAGTSLGYLEFDGAGNVDWYNGSSNNITTWSAATEYNPEFNFDFSNDEVTIAVAGTTATFALQNTASGYDEINIGNDTTASTGTVNAYFDDVKQYETVYTLDKGESMHQTAGITELTDANGVSYTKGTDFTDADTDGDGDIEGLEWVAGATEPDIGVSFDVTYRIAEDVPINTTEVANEGTITATVV